MFPRLLVVVSSVFTIVVSAAPSAGASKEFRLGLNKARTRIVARGSSPIEHGRVRGGLALRLDSNTTRQVFRRDNGRLQVVQIDEAFTLADDPGFPRGKLTKQVSAYVKDLGTDLVPANARASFTFKLVNLIMSEKPG